MKEENRLKAGFSQSIITPKPQTVFLDGFGERITPAEGVRDDLYVKAFVLCSEQLRYALVAFDACGFEQRIILGLQRRIAIENGLPPDCVTICATHTHSAPASGILGDLPVNYFWWDQVGEIAAKTVQDAFRTADFCELDVLHAGKLFSIKNRRGRAQCDKNIKVCEVRSQSGISKGILVLASCHATCYSGMSLSADYPSVLAEKLHDIYPDAVVLFLQGRGADVNPDFPNAISGDEKISRLGGELAEKVIEASTLQNYCTITVNNPPIILRSKLQIPMLPYPDKKTILQTIDFFERQRNAAGNGTFEQRRIVREIYWHQMALLQTEQKQASENSLQIELQIVKFSEKMIWVFLPFEIFTETGNQIEELCKAKGYDADSIFVVSHANGTNGYLIPESEFDMQDYETLPIQYWYQKTLLANQLHVEELTLGHYEVINAPHWYHLPQCSRQSEREVVRGIIHLLSQL